MKKLLFSAAVLSITLLGGCAKGGSGPCAVNCPGVTIEPIVQSVGLNVSVPLTLVFNQYTSAQAMTWAIQPTSCGSECGTLTNVTGSTATYVGPSTVPSSPATFTITVTSQTSGLTGTTEALTIIPVTAQVAPLAPNVQVGLTEQYTAVALPEQAPQTFTWSCMVNGVQCANFSPAPNQTSAGVATYTPTPGEECSSSGCVTISAIATVDPTGCTINPKIVCAPSQTTVVTSRVPAGQYSFQFSGYDSNGKAIAVAGTFTIDSGGSISGYEDEWTSGGLAKRAFSGGSYNPIAGSNPNSNNAGTLSLNTGAFPSSYSVVLDAAGDIQMIAAAGGDSGSGIAEPAATNKFNKGSSATFAFGFTGVDASNNRVGYAGLVATDGVSAVTSGLIDANDNGNATNGICNVSAAPCTVTGSYAPDGTVSNLWHLTLTAPVAMTFDFFVANGNESNANNPLYLYAISTDSNPAVMGTMVLQDSKITSYDNGALTGGSVSAVTGVNGNVAIVLGDLDGSGDFTGTFGENNNGTLILLPPTNPCPTVAMPHEVCQFGNTYAATNNNTGRYTLQMLGNPNASTAIAPLPFIFYASGANRGFLLDPSSTAVFTGTMNAQVPPKQNLGNFAAGSALGPYAVATYSSSAPSDAACLSSDSLLTACSVTMNLLLTEPSDGIYDVTGTENPSTAFSAIYALGSGGSGTFGPLSGATTPNYWMFAVTETSFFLIDVDTNSSGPLVVSPILFMTQ
jgi:hypothetical protein